MEALWPMQALLARWFRFQPSELDGLEIEALVKWCELAREQITAERTG